MTTACRVPCASTRSIPRTRGFTILELMMTIAVIAVLAGIAAPSFMSIIRANRIVTDNNDLISALTLARSEAIKRGVRVTVCPTTDQAACDTSGQWERGWMVFADLTVPGSVTAGDEIIRVWEARDGGTTIRAGGSFSDFVSFVASGETRATPSNADLFNVCDADGDVALGRTINVGLIGYARTEKGATACP